MNDGLVDPVFDATQPEVMLYAPTKNGRLELVAVEYIVINTGQARPTNPSGLFAPFNPDVDRP